MYVRTVLLAAAAVVAGFATTTVGVSPALARTPTGQVAVSYADLNLANASGRATLDRRIVGAVRQLCTHPTPTLIALQADSRQCAIEALNSAAPQRDALFGRRPSVSVSTTAY